jgi:DNA-binding NarL/FixJ family response regulator
MTGSRGNQADELIEREDEVALIRAALTRASDGAGSVVVVEGPAGIGKTRLLRAIAADNVLVLRASGGELERDFAYGVVHQLFDRALAGLGPAARRAAFAGAGGLAAPLLGFAGEADSTEHLPAPLDPTFGVVHGLYWLVANLAADRQLLIEVDDAHWADAPSLRFLVYLARRLDGVPALILVAAREGEAGGPRAVLEGLAALEQTQVVRPRELSVRGAAEMLGAVFGSSVAREFAAACHAVTRGNPYLLRELAATLRADGVEPTESAAAHVGELGPSAIARSVLLRLGRLPQGATALARALAVLGGEADVAHATALAELDEPAAIAAIEALTAAQILDPERSLRFVHPIVRTSIYEDLAPAERSMAHGRAARVLMRAGADPDRVAPQLLACAPAGDAEAVEVLRRAAASALSKGSAEVAVRYLARAVTEPPPAAERGDVLAELGAAEQRAGSQDAIAHLNAAIQLTRDPATRAERRLVLARALFAAGDEDAAVSALDAGIAEAAPVDRELALRLEAELSSFGLLDASIARLASDRLERFEEVRGVTPAERVLLSALATRAWAQCRPSAEAAELGRRSLGAGRLLAEQTADAPAVYQAIFALLLADELEEAEAALDEALAEARARGLVFGFAAASSLRAMLAARRGDMPTAEGEARAATDATMLHGFVTPLSIAFLVEALIARGELDEADAALSDGGFAGDLPETAPFLSLLFRRGMLRLAQGRDGEGLADLTAVGEREERLGMASPVTSRRCVQGLLHAAAGRHDEAARLVTQHLELARRWGTASAIGVGLRAHGLIAADGGVELLREAVETLERSPARLELAQALVDLGAARRRAGLRTDARPPLRRGLDLARDCGATVLAERAHEELVTAGSRPRRRAFSGVEALTAAERRVAGLAADGMANREIAQALFVTVRTVENHLARVYSKLGVHSRAELPRAFGKDE